jgi:hypothetical protein
MGPIFEPSDRLVNLPAWYLRSRLGATLEPTATP